MKLDDVVEVNLVDRSPKETYRPVREIVSKIITEDTAVSRMIEKLPKRSLPLVPTSSASCKTSTVTEPTLFWAKRPSYFLAGITSRTR